MSKLSCVIICKNEEAMLAQCLDSIKWVDDIYITDTGSEDRTVEIAKKYTNNVSYYEWNDDFSQARNYAKSFVDEWWVLSIDADEVLEEWWIDKIRKAMESWADWIYVNLSNWVDTLFSNVRVFKKEKNWSWKIHEAIWWIESFMKCDAKIIYWTSPAHSLDPDLDFRILQKVHEEEPNNTRNLFYLAREYFYKNDFDKAIELYLKYISLNSSHYSEVTDAYYRLARCYWYDGKGHWELSRECLMKAIIRNVNFRAPFLLMAEQMIDEKKKATWLKMAEVADNSNCLFVY